MPSPRASVSKGKARALTRLPSTNSDSDLLEDRNGINGEASNPSGPQASPQLPRRIPFRQAWSSYLVTAALALLTLFFGAVLALILLADSYAAPALRNVNGALSDSRAGAGGDKFWKEAILLHGPDSVRLTGVKRGPILDGNGAERLEVNLTVSLRVAVDTDFIMGFREDNTDDDFEPSWWRERWKVLGRWGVAKLETATAVVEDVLIYPSGSADSSEPLVQIKLRSPITVPLLPGISTHQNPIPLSLLPQSLSVPISVYPSQNATLLLDFLKKSWCQGYVSVRIHGSDLMILGGKMYGSRPKLWELDRWRNWFEFVKPDVKLGLRLPIPPFKLPSQPPSKPGSDLPNLADLLVLESFSITSAPSLPTPPFPIPTDDYSSSLKFMKTEQSALALEGTESPKQLSPKAWDLLINARASLPHPFASLGPKLGLGKGFPPLPFTVSLPVPSEYDKSATPDVIPVVKVCTSLEFNETHIVIPLWGYVLPLGKSSDSLPSAISAFISSYLSYLPSPISIATPLYPSLTINANFPPPQHRLELLKDVSIENMSIHPGSIVDFLKGGLNSLNILASGTVHARVVLPQGFDVNVQVMRIWVDCLVYDGKVSSGSEPGSESLFGLSNFAFNDGAGENEPPLPEPFPLPSPLPLRAFGRITPRTWLNATSSSTPQTHVSTSPEEGSSVYVTAQVVDVPLEVLPGRQGDLSRFVTKVLFSSKPVAAGVRGFAAVGASIPGLTTQVRNDIQTWVTKPRVEGNELILNGLPFEGNVLVGGYNF